MVRTARPIPFSYAPVRANTSQAPCAQPVSTRPALPLSRPRTTFRSHKLAAALGCTCFLPSASLLIAQAPPPATVAAITLPDAPAANLAQGSSSQTPPASSPAASAPAAPQQTNRILGVLPNFRAVSTGTILPPQTPKEKFKTGFEDSFDYSSFLFAGAQAGVAQATKSYPAFHQGAAGYARYFWHTFADQASENLMVESIIPTLTHEDSRYYTLGHGGFVKRSVYAVSRAAITRSDHGGETVNISEIVGAGAAAGISNTYYPGQYNTWTKAGQRWLTNIVLDDALLYVKEFWPDINQHLVHGQN